MLCVIAGAVLILRTEAVVNSWLLLTGNGYEIPTESSLLSFKPTVMNAGSGDWWIYGEDGRNYYFTGTGETGAYIVLPKGRAMSCPDFDPTEYGSWCR